MIAHSALYEEAVRFSNTMSTIVDIYRGDDRVYPAVPVTGGTVTSDRGSKVRWSSSVELALYPWEEMPLLDAYRSRYKVYRGLTSLGLAEMIQLGEYRVNEIGRSDDGTIQLSGSGLESYLVDARFPTPRVPPYGSSTLAAIKQLITEAVPATPPFIPMNTTDRAVLATAPWEKERIDAVMALGDSINADVFANNAGVFVTKDKPSVVSRIPVFVMNAGVGGVLLGEQVKATRDGVYNAVSVTGQSSDQSIPPVFGWAADMDVTSDTYYNGDFGQKPMFYSSQYIYSVSQANGVANNLLMGALAVNQSLSFDSMAICFLEAGDVVRVILSDGTEQDNMLQKVSIGLDHGGTLKADTFVNRSGAGGDT